MGEYSLSRPSGVRQKKFEKNPQGSVAMSRKAVYNEIIMQNYVDLPRKREGRVDN